MKKVEKIFKFIDKYLVPLWIFAAGFACGALYGFIKTLFIIA